jgi:hypothetical protein
MLKQIITGILLSLILIGCSTDVSENESDHSALIKIYNNEEMVLEKRLFHEDGNITIPVVSGNDTLSNLSVLPLKKHNCISPSEENCSYSYRLYLPKENSYSNTYSISEEKELSIHIDKEFEKLPSNKICGTFLDNGYDKLSLVKGYVFKDDILTDSITTDKDGRFACDIDYGSYELRFYYENCDTTYIKNDFTVDSMYKDYFLDYLGYCEKPNIYIYPKKKIKMDVTIDFPMEGEVTESIPLYKNGWKNITVEPSGLIDGKYDYLYYESLQPKFFQKNRGWIVPKENLEKFFIENLKKNKFNKKEIDDFIEYWIPLLNKRAYYEIYPQYNKELV